MAKYDITFSCGHAETKQLFGKETDRQRYISWAEKSGECAACRADDKAAEMVACEAQYGLPALTGSDKQVAWARNIRAKKIAEFAAQVDAARGRVTAEKSDEFEARVAEGMTALAGQDAANWWIDARDLAATAVVARAAAL